MKEENNCKMTEDLYMDIISYCCEILDILQKLNAGECFIKGLLLYELASAKIKVVEFKKEYLDDVSSLKFDEVNYLFLYNF